MSKKRTQCEEQANNTSYRHEFAFCLSQTKKVLHIQNLFTQLHLLRLSFSHIQREVSWKILLFTYFLSVLRIHICCFPPLRYTCIYHPNTSFSFLSLLQNHKIKIDSVGCVGRKVGRGVVVKLLVSCEEKMGEWKQHGARNSRPASHFIICAIYNYITYMYTNLLSSLPCLSYQTLLSVCGCIYTHILVYPTILRHALIRKMS